MRKILLSTVAIATMATVATAGGDITPVEPTAEVTDVAKVEAEKSILDRIHFKGDLRLRYESIERDDADNKYRNRYRLRLGAKIDLIDNLQF